MPLLARTSDRRYVGPLCSHWPVPVMRWIVAGSKLLVVPGIGKIREIVHGIIEIKIVVVHAVHEIPQVVNSRHGEASLENIRMLEQGICGVVSTERGSHRGDRHPRLAVLPDERHNFFAQIGSNTDWT